MLGVEGKTNIFLSTLSIDRIDHELAGSGVQIMFELI